MKKTEKKESALKGTVEVTNIFKVNAKEGKKATLRANCTIKIAECMYINNILLMETADEFFINFPSKVYQDKDGNDKRADFVIVDRETKDYITEKIVEAYEKAK